MLFQQIKNSLLLALLAGASSPLWGLTKAPPEPLAERVKSAKMVFVGTVVNRVEDGEWVRAELQIDEALRDCKKGDRVPVIWRRMLGQQEIYDAKENDHGVALLNDEHENRYWLRDDKFEPLAKLDKIRKLVEMSAAVPTYEEWLSQGKPIPAGRVFTGGSPWFDESTGTNRDPRAVYSMLYGNAVPLAKHPAPGKKAFPAHWGEPPKAQTRDLRPLPGGYGSGSGTLARWIQLHLDEDAKDNGEVGAPGDGEVIRARDKR